MPTAPSPTLPRWPWPPLVTASAALHVAAAGVALGGAPWWALGAVALDHAALTAAGLWPRSDWLGPNVTRLPAAAAARGEIALTIDDGPDAEVTPPLLDLLAELGLRASFFCIGERARAQPALLRRIVAAGHEIQNHSLSHPHHFSLMGPRGIEREVGDAQALLADLAGVAPLGFRAPAGLRNPLLDPVLHRHGLHLVSWTRRGFDTRCADPAIVLERLQRQLAGGDILLLHDGHARRGAGGRPVLLDVLPPLARRLADAGLRTATLAEALPRRRP
ncbi:MAG: polysaccharide deacetylase family protein [Burkholderiales bacterium]|nr:polysaccharide deacetylase family protein [Burkholderiales bacterium]